MRTGKNRVIAVFLNICEVLTSYNDGISQKLRQTLGQTDSPASVARSSQEQIPMKITQPTVQLSSGCLNMQARKEGIRSVSQSAH